MPKNTPTRIKTRSGHEPRARLHAPWSPIGQQKRRAAVVRALGIVVGLLLVAGVAADAYAEAFMASLPSIKGLDTATFKGDTLIYDRNGVLLADVGEHGDRHLIVKLNQISPKLIQATIAIEDKNFYTNPGFDLEGIIRAALENWRSGHIVGGASTITQQLARAQFLTPEQSVERKLKEIALAYELSQTYSKDQILELYMNKTYYGNQAYGAEAAAQNYFHKHALNLDVAESAMLAGLPQAPTEWNPVLHPAQAKLRQREVLQAMLRSGSITPAEEVKAEAEVLTYSPPVNTFLAPHFVNYVLEELHGLGFREGTQQLVVRSTLDLEKQNLAAYIINENLDNNRWRDPYGQMSTAMVAVNPPTGQIIVMVGSPDYNADKGQINLTTTPRNVGSSIKPYNYAAVINARRATMQTPIYDGPSPFVWKTAYEEVKFYNYDHRSHGVLPLREALGNSLNIPAVKVELSIGVPAVVEYMRNVGVYPRVGRGCDQCFDKVAPLNEYGPSVTLGGYPITLLEHATGLSTIAGMGVYHSPESILTVSDIKGKVLWQSNPDQTRRQAMDPGVAFIMAQILSDDTNRYKIFGPNSTLHLPERTAAAKSGTTDTWKDALTVGFTPDLAAVVWLGDILDNTHTMVPGSDGTFVAGPAWHKFMQNALIGVPDKWYSPPSDVVQGPGNSWFLSDATSIAGLPNDARPSPTPTPIDYGVPADPGTGPVLARPSPSPSPSPSPTPCLTLPTPCPSPRPH